MVELSQGERLILFMLSEVYKHLKIEGEIDHNFVQAAIVSNQFWALDWKFGSIISGENNPSKAEIGETNRILAMWNDIEGQIEEMSGSDRSRLKAETGIDDPKFNGFDANEGPHYGIAKFIIKQMNQYQRFKDRYLNSHRPNIEAESRMLSAYEDLLNSNPLTTDQVITVLNARKLEDR